MDLKYKELELSEMRNIRSIKEFVCEFLKGKQQQYEEYKREIKEIYTPDPLIMADCESPF
jgi:hypothetical protein